MPEEDVEPRNSRDKILIAAATMLGEDPTVRLSVRAVAARAEVSTGSLRHFFPTQQALVDTVVAGLSDVEIPGDPILDSTRTPADRLLACMQQMLAPVGVGQQARDLWRKTYQAYVVLEPSSEGAATYSALERLTRHRIQRWLTILADEGHAAAGNGEQNARFLATVLSGLFTERALPSDAAGLAAEVDTLRLAVGAVLASGSTPAEVR